MKGGEEGSKKEKDEESEDGTSASKGDSLPLHSPLPSLHCNALSYPIFLFSLPCFSVLHPNPSYSFSPYLHLSCAHPTVNLIVNCAATGRVSVADMGLGLPSPALLARDYRSVRAIQVPCTALHHSIPPPSSSLHFPSSSTSPPSTASIMIMYFCFSLRQQVCTLISSYGVDNSYLCCVNLVVCALSPDCAYPYLTFNGLSYGDPSSLFIYDRACACFKIW